jgi:hypothetical protein
MKKHGYTPTTFAHPGGSQFWWLDQKLYQYFNLLRDVSLKKESLAIGYLSERLMRLMKFILDLINPKA